MRSLVKQLILSLLRVMAHLQLVKYRAKIVGVTGSVGKTGTVAACQLVLAHRHSVLPVREGHNSEFGIPLSILKQESGYSSPLGWAGTLIRCFKTLIRDWSRYDYILLEMGVDKPWDMAYLLSFIKPQIGIFLNVAPVHTEAFAEFDDPVAEVAREKGLLITTLPENGTAILNTNDARVISFASRTRARVMRFSTDGGSDAVASNVQLTQEGLRFRVVVADEEAEAFFPNILSRAYLTTFLSALALGSVVGNTLEETLESLKQFRLPPCRLSILRGVKGTTLIDGSYNASAQSMLAALEALSLFKNQRRIAVLGDMRELGPLAQVEHEKVAERVVEVVDQIFLVGPLMRQHFLPKALALGYPKNKITAVGTVSQMIEPLENTLAGGEAILFKGSQNTIFLEKAVEHFLADPTEADRVLCRRGIYWDRVRIKY